MSDGSTVSISKSRRESLIKWFVWVSFSLIPDYLLAHKVQLPPKRSSYPMVLGIGSRADYFW